MREYTVNWQTFEQAKPKEGTPIVVETDKGCVTGKFGYTSNLKIGKVARFVRKNGIVKQVRASSRWYPIGSEQLKQNL